MLNIDDRLIRQVSPKIGANALSVLLAIAIHLNQKTNRAFPSHSRLMELTGLGRDAVYKALSTLQKEGLLKSVQKIDSKRKTFGRREFKVDTTFIKIFVAAADMEPLPENPYTAEPYTAEPYTVNQETYQLNKVEQINNIEQISEREHAPAQNVSSTLDAAIPPPPQVPPAPPAPWKAIDCTHEIELMRNDEACAFRFVRDTSLPQAEYPAALDAFLLKAQTEAKVYNNRTDIRSHFFNWASGPYKKMKNERPKFSFGPDSARRAIESAERLAREIESGNY